MEDKKVIPATIDKNTLPGMLGLTGPQGALIGAGLSGLVGGLTAKQQAEEEEAKFKAQGIQQVGVAEGNRNAFQQQILNNLSAQLTSALLK
jgi:hypothetical protein